MEQFRLGLGQLQMVGLLVSGTGMGNLAFT